MMKCKSCTRRRVLRGGGIVGSDIHFTLMVRLDESGKGVGGVGKFEKGRRGV